MLVTLDVDGLLVIQRALHFKKFLVNQAKGSKSSIPCALMEEKKCASSLSIEGVTPM